MYPKILRYIHFAMQAVFLPMSDYMLNYCQGIKANTKKRTEKPNQTKTNQERKIHKTPPHYKEA